MEDFSSSYSKNYCFYLQQATKTQTFILLESATVANSFSGKKFVNAPCVKECKRQSREKDK